jgi:hypothetical protein
VDFARDEEDDGRVYGYLMKKGVSGMKSQFAAVYIRRIHKRRDRPIRAVSHAIE